MRLEIKNGTKFNELTVVKEVDALRLPSGQTNRAFLCVCNCGNTKVVRLVHLKNNRTKSCGCLNDLSKKYKHENQKYIRNIYRAIKYRTSKKYCQSYLYYDKGIIVCDQWKNDYNKFYQWAIKNGLKKGYQIDRIDGNGNYSPENCRIVTPKENCNNRENTFFVNYKGEKYAFTELVEIKKLNKNKAAIRGRLKRGWSTEKAFDTPIRKGNYLKKTTTPTS